MVQTVSYSSFASQRGPAVQKWITAFLGWLPPPSSPAVYQTPTPFRIYINSLWTVAGTRSGKSDLICLNPRLRDFR